MFFCVGRLWCILTPEAQCLGEKTTEYEETTVTVSQPEIFTYDLLEKDRLQKEENEIVLGKHEIRTIGWRG